jgi:predicted SAM-dependent methyltransferase
VKLLVNLGCGDRLVQPPGDGWIAVQHDLTTHRPQVDVAWDLNIRPWPWADGSVSAVIGHSVFEHLQITLIESMNEAWRILKVNGRLDIKLPLYNRKKSWLDPTHRWLVAEGVLDNFDPTKERGKRYGKLYGIRPWRIETQGADADATCLRGILTKVLSA